MEMKLHNEAYENLHESLARIPKTIHGLANSSDSDIENNRLRLSEIGKRYTEDIQKQYQLFFSDILKHIDNPVSVHVNNIVNDMDKGLFLEDKKTLRTPLFFISIGPATCTFYFYIYYVPENQSFIISHTGLDGDFDVCDHIDMTVLQTLSVLVGYKERISRVCTDIYNDMNVLLEYIRIYDEISTNRHGI